MNNDPYCLKCAGAEVYDYFCSCVAVCNTWSWLKRQVVQLGQMEAGVEDEEIINLCFVKSRHETEIVWLVGSYVLYVWEMVHIKKLEVKLEKFFGFLTFKYKMDQAISPDRLQNLHYI